MLKDRAHMLASARSFFSDRKVLEVDCPTLCKGVIVDAYIDAMKVVQKGNTFFLHTSPEAGMKKLLAMGIGDIYQISHIFREGEISPIHNPEFTLIEWYRKDLPFEAFIEETLDFIRLFVGSLPSEELSYKEAFATFAKVDISASTQELLQCAQAHQLILSPEIERSDCNTLLDFLLSFVVEPHLGKGRLTVIRDYPPHQAALAKTVRKKGSLVAERFEIYYRGVELCNGYHESTDALELRKRFEEENTIRKSLGKDPQPLDEEFLHILEKKGLPECCGVAVGFDRLLMLKNHKICLSEIMVV